VIKSADYIIDLGPEGGTHGGRVVATGTPEEVARSRRSHTGQVLRPLLNGNVGRNGNGAKQGGSKVSSIPRDEDGAVTGGRPKKIA